MCVGIEVFYVVELVVVVGCCCGYELCVEWIDCVVLLLVFVDCVV